jgi:hypothetical protein
VLHFKRERDYIYYKTKAFGIIHSLAYLFSISFLNVHYAPGTSLDTRDPISEIGRQSLKKPRKSNKCGK